MSTPIPQPTPEQPDDPAANTGATSSERAQAAAVHERSEPERLDGSQGPA